MKTKQNKTNPQQTVSTVDWIKQNLWSRDRSLKYPHSSVGRESACNAGDPGLIPGSGRSAGEGIGYPFQYSWSSLMAQLVKTLPAMWETWVRSLGWKDPLEKGYVSMLLSPFIPPSPSSSPPLSISLFLMSCSRNFNLSRLTTRKPLEKLP